ncbi:DUF4012 domain-containing protein [Pseudarthrobacter sp. NPDC080037]|uniref:DUF4012 domain-containing protein n=1 Tax=Pseudarthrobacter sp. NPDC080037 TaxID=3155289 RepID=UPI00344B8836
MAVATIWLGNKAKIISDELNAASSLIPALKEEISQGQPAKAAATVEQLRGHSALAHQAANDPVWTLATSLPVLGSNFSAVAEVARSADDVANLGIAPLVQVYSAVGWESLLPNSTGTDLAPLEAASPKIVAAADTVRLTADRLNRIDTSALMPQVAHPLNNARDRLQEVAEALDAAADASKIMPEMLGTKTPRSYLLMIQNNAEARATGGIPGALAVIRSDKGRISLTAQGSAHDLGIFNPPISVDTEQQGIYSTRLGRFMQDVTLTPDFPTAAATASKMWEQRTGQKLDGAISMDPVALSYILEATGPVNLEDPQLRALGADKLPSQVSSNNVVKTLLSDAYAQFNNPKLQDVYFAGVAKEVFAALSSGKGDAKALLTEVEKGVEEHRILLWSADSTEQSVIGRYPVSGAITGPSVPAAQFGVYFNDATGAKMDYHVKRTVQLVQECTDNGYGQVKVRITSTNTAATDAATSLPAYVTGDGTFGVPPGTVQTNITAYGPVQANIETSKLDGQQTPFAPYMHSNRPVGVVAVRLAPGERKTVEFTFGKIVQQTKPTVIVTPTVQPVKDVVLPTENASCGQEQ